MHPLLNRNNEARNFTALSTLYVRIMRGILTLDIIVNTTI